MVTIGHIPRVLSSFFRPIRPEFSRRGWPHLWGLVMAFAVGTDHTLERLNALLRNHAHRTNDGEFLWRSAWDESWVLREIALNTLQRLRRKGEPLYLILDDTQTLKRAKKMDAVGTLWHHAEKRYVTGHTILKACLYYRGVTIPWASCLYVKKDAPAKVKRAAGGFSTLTGLAARIIRQANLPGGMPVTVLFDSYYLCPTVVQAVRARGWHYIGVAKSNRRFTVDGRSHSLGRYGPNVVRRSGQWHRIAGLKGQREYCVARRVGHLKKLGEVQVVFSRRRGERSVIALVTDDPSRPARMVVADYLRRWSVELLIKDEKQHLGLGAYRVLRYRAVVRHLHLVDAAYACLTHLGLKTHGAQGHQRNRRVLHLPPIRQLKADLRRVVWRQAIKEVANVSHERPVLRRLEKLLAA